MITPQNNNSPSITPIIVIDGVFFQFNKTGIARVWQSLLQQWSQSNFAHHVIVLDRNSSVPRFPKITYLDIHPYDYRYSAQDSCQLQAICDQVNADVFISTYYTTPLTTPSIFMAYDFVPEALKFELNDPSWREKHQAILHANHFITISQNTADDLVRFFPFVSPSLVTVAHCGVAPLFKPANSTEIQDFLLKYSIESPYILFVGSRLGYKNAKLVFQALNQLDPNDSLSLICVGGNVALEPELTQLLDQKRVYLLHLEDEELKTAYSGATALVYPSYYEGFGLPLVEAMACGCPIITCCNSSIPEVVGSAAIYVNENNIEEMLNAIKKVKNPEIHQNLQEKGWEQVQQFSWNKMAKIIRKVLENTSKDDLEKRLIWQQLRLTSQEIEAKNAEIYHLKQSLINSSSQDLPQLESSKLSKKVLLSFILGIIITVILLLSNNEFLLNQLVFIRVFTWEIGLVAIALISGILGYYELIPSQPLRWFRIMCGITGIGLILLRLCLMFL